LTIHAVRLNLLIEQATGKHDTAVLSFSIKLAARAARGWTET